MIEAFRRHLSAERNLSAHTVRAYCGDLANLLGHLERVGEGAVADIDLIALRRWLAWQQAGGAERATLQRRAATVRTFFAWAKRTPAGSPPIPPPGCGRRAPTGDCRPPSRWITCGPHWIG